MKSSSLTVEVSFEKTKVHHAEMDKYWDEMIKLAQKYGFLCAIAKGMVIMATHRYQVESWGINEYIRIQENYNETIPKIIKLNSMRKERCGAKTPAK